MYGQTIKKIRKEKNLKQKEICQNIVTLSYYSRIERNVSVPTIDVFMKIIENLNVSLEEFMYIHNNYTKTLNDQTWFEITELYHIGDIKKLENYKQNILDGRIKHENKITVEFINLFIRRLGGKYNGEGETQAVIKRLMNLENWTNREVTIFITIMDEIPIETLILIINRLLKKRNLYFVSNGYNSPYSKILINAILLCVNHRYLNEGFNYLKIFKKTLEVRDLFGKTMSLFLEGLLSYSQGDKVEGELKVNESFQIFQILNMEKFSHKYKLYFETIKEKN
jgi:Rgg/GadR/MutR family transcriptional activator